MLAAAIQSSQCFHSIVMMSIPDLIDVPMVSSVPAAAAAAAAAVLSSSGQTDRGLLGCTYKMAKFPPSLFKAVTVLKHENYKTKANVSVSFATSLCFSPRVIFTASHNRRRLDSPVGEAPEAARHFWGQGRAERLSTCTKSNARPESLAMCSLQEGVITRAGALVGGLREVKENRRDLSLPAPPRHVYRSGHPRAPRPRRRGRAKFTSDEISLHLCITVYRSNFTFCTVPYDFISIQQKNNVQYPPRMGKGAGEAQTSKATRSATSDLATVRIQPMPCTHRAAASLRGAPPVARTKTPAASDGRSVPKSYYNVVKVEDSPPSVPQEPLVRSRRHHRRHQQEQAAGATGRRRLAPQRRLLVASDSLAARSLLHYIMASKTSVFCTLFIIYIPMLTFICIYLYDMFHQ
ncbi:hypothetical protein E2C01_058121 [Portunus trituberculatus]|uniref:Uncharacterized protein n=1 Tax=Portunus trituberculatus TaxID=210409 RepID=A0A5B7GUR4_PORTR|nr:hypothetical protein [Portunus trituberculatus]